MAGREGPLPAHAGSKPRPNRREPARSLPPQPPYQPNPINAWHRLSNRLTNAAPPIAGRLGRALSYQASLRASCQFEVIETIPALRDCPRVARLAGAPRRVQVVLLTVRLWCNGSSVCAQNSLFPHYKS